MTDFKQSRRARAKDRRREGNNETNESSAGHKGIRAYTIWLGDNQDSCRPAVYPHPHDPTHVFRAGGGTVSASDGVERYRGASTSPMEYLNPHDRGAHARDSLPLLFACCWAGC
ncbi:hypothetical protein AAFF_G00403760 [Aldrovandia affinis]|uniref:Uncharacterized protein n=1 Tax=Aldrovandia affinis TaxID=143900 RepID=A0AAD7T7H9_9TELE|nr:hypothetical protein AAFF_G00403760 [Aldrovandia affinis]